MPSDAIMTFSGSGNCQDACISEYIIPHYTFQTKHADLSIKRVSGVDLQNRLFGIGMYRNYLFYF